MTEIPAFKYEDNCCPPPGESGTLGIQTGGTYTLSIHQDKELDAIDSVVRVIKNLDDTQTQRVLDYINARFNKGRY